jgi:hypothetical protein
MLWRLRLVVHNSAGVCDCACLRQSLLCSSCITAFRRVFGNISGLWGACLRAYGFQRDGGGLVRTQSVSGRNMLRSIMPPCLCVCHAVGSVGCWFHLRWLYLRVCACVISCFVQVVYTQLRSFGWRPAAQISSDTIHSSTLCHSLWCAVPCAVHHDGVLTRPISSMTCTRKSTV